MNDLAEARYAASVMRAHIDRSFAVEDNPDASELLEALRGLLVHMDLSNTFARSFGCDATNWACGASMPNALADLTSPFHFLRRFHG